MKFLYYVGNKKTAWVLNDIDMDWVLSSRVLSLSVYYNSESAERLLVVRYLRIELIRVTKNILMKRKYSYIHQKGVVFGKILLKRKSQIC